MAAPELSLAFGGGGVFGLAYGLGVMDALISGGVVIDQAPLLGTSAGAWVAACLATGLRRTAFEQLPPIRVPDPRRGFLEGIARELFGDARSERVTVSAFRLASASRVLLSGRELPLARIVAASSSVPVLFRPVRIGRWSYVDGGVRSLVSADQALAARHLLVVAPIAGPMFGPGGRAMEAMLRAELRRWAAVTGGTTWLIRPNARIAAMARNPLQLFDKARAHEVYPLAHEQATALLRGLRQRGEVA